MVDWEGTGLVYFLQLGDVGQVLDSFWTFVSSAVKLVITSVMVLP